LTQLQFQTVESFVPNDKLKSLFDQNWPHYKKWFLDEGESKRPTFLACNQAIKHYMPEMLPLYIQLLDLFDCDDLQARFLSLYNPPPFYSGCSQLIWNRDQKVLIRNYDFPPFLCEGKVIKSAWLDKQLIVVSDCIWGALDGINNEGLTASIAYGGRKVEGEGFGITLVVRYVLETCTTVAEAIEVFQRVPVHLDYNIALLDKQGHHATLYISPDRGVEVTDNFVSTNHHGFETGATPLFLADSLIREDCLKRLSNSATQTLPEVKASFLKPPLFRLQGDTNSGTLYTAAYFPDEGRVEYIWPGQHWNISFDSFTEASILNHYQ